MKQNDARKGFTLIELVLVVAILAIIATLAVGKFGDLRKQAARKVNLASLNNISRAIDTELARTDVVSGMFDYLESLVDVSSSGATTGGAGNYVWDSTPASDAANAWVSICPGVYRGVKEVGAMQNAGGVASATKSLAEYREGNQGLPGSFARQLGVHYLTADEAAALAKAGISVLLQHNYKNSQSSQVVSGHSTYGDAKLPFRNGGPGLRADMSAFYPAVVTNGSPVVVVRPVYQGTRGTSTARDLYTSLGSSFSMDPDSESGYLSRPEQAYADGCCPRIVLFGLGRSSDVTAALFEAPPRAETLDKTYYRNYLLAFEMLNGTGNTGYTVRFLGVVDPEGNTAKGAQYNVDWAG